MATKCPRCWIRMVHALRRARVVMCTVYEP